MSDLKTSFFIPLLEFHLRTPIEKGNTGDYVIGSEVLEDFLIKENVLTLYAAVATNEEEKQIKFFTEVSAINDRVVVFYKTRPCILTEKTLNLIQIASLTGSPSAALYHSLQNVFAPLLTQQHDKKNLTNNVQKQLANLQAGLRSVVFAPDALVDPLKADDTLSVIISLDHEVDYWNVVSKSSKSKDQRIGMAFCEILKPLARDFSVLDALPLTDVEDLLENAHNILDSLWQHEPPYPKIRTQHLMDLIATDIIKCVNKTLTGIDIWSKDFNVVSELLHQCISILKHWESSCSQLTNIFWPNYSLHTWSGDPYVPQNLMEFVQRLEEILNVRIVHRQIIRLLTASEEQDLSTGDMFKPFEDLNILDSDSYTEAAWKTSIKKFEYLLQPAEERVAVKLRNQLANITNTRQLLYEFGRYSELISRQVVKHALLTQRQYLLSLLNDYVKQLSGQLNGESQTVASKFDTPQIVGEITSIRQLESRVTDVQKTVEKLLDDLPGSEDLNSAIIELLKNVKQQHTELFDSWTSEITAKIKDNSLSLKETDPVVQFSANKMMRVNYSSQLVTLIREVRQLAILGYRIPNSIEEISNHAKQFMKHAKILEQITNFHNTIGDRMIPSQKAMMLASALELSKLVQEQEVVSWGNVESVEKYVQNLKLAVEKLSKENNLLTAYHLQSLEKIKSLEDVDLIKYFQKWKETTKALRDIVAQVEQKGFKSMHSWKTDIDNQLCSVLEVQYLKSLNSLHLYLPEIHSDLVYRDSELQFLPNKETLKEKYQQQLKRFLDIPKSFRGVNSENTIFSKIINRNQEELQKVNTHADKLLEQLDGVVKHWQSWLTLGTLDTTQLTSWEHWDLQFRASKTFGQEIAKLPSAEERIGCFIIGLSWLRSDLESHNRSYWSQLTLSLKDSIAQDVFKLQQYVDTSTATLNKQPLSLDQIGQADASHANVLSQKLEMESLYKEMTRKSQMLSSWTRERVDSVNRLQAAWERLQSLLDNYEHIIARQLETMKSSLGITSENLQGEMERFAAKWEQVKPRPHSGQITEESLTELQKHLENIKEKRVQLNELVSQRDKLLQDYARFSMAAPDFSNFEKIELDVDQEEKMWTLFEEFSQELEKLSNEEWIVFRKKSYKLEDFLTSWQAKLEKNPSSEMSTRILQEIQKYQAALPSLKYVRGDDFTEKHWIEALSLIGVTPKPVDLLCLGDFLSASNSLANYSSELQAICKRAASEIVVRQALAELDQWDVQNKFSLIDHTDSHGKSITLIKDFKEILNKVGDNQSLLQSVKNSADYESFTERAEIWEAKLADLDQYITSLAQIQRKWIYLEPIFGGGTLIQEKARFERLDKDFRYLMAYIARDSRVTALSRYPNIRGILENVYDQLSRCQNSLDNFLIEKRNKFPRFLFLGDDDLLEVVGQSSKEQVIQAHLKKLFAGIHRINLDLGGKSIESMCSLHGEVVFLKNSIDIDQPVENWLNTLVEEMQNSLKELFVQCLADGQNADPLKYPSQILCLADSVTFTTKCEQAISSMNLASLLTSYKSQLGHYSSLEFNEGADKSLQFDNDGDDSNLLELKLKALLLDTIHHISVIEQLVQANVVNTNDWNWQRQLRYYSDPSGKVTVKMVNAVMEYSYEYLGNQSKLVRTPLTDKCFLTLTQGMHLGMGGNPYGPAGTGKTESVKALGSLLGRQVLVFNCDDGIDAASMGRILSGLVKSGAWGCFDEFNRLDEATLSAVSMHIQPIQNALRLNQETITLLDQEMKVNRHCGIFITLNPAGGDYGGRNKLPDSLKQLFRPVVMTHPDHKQIATTLLHCDGFRNVDVIGHKLVEIFSCAGKLLSKQKHYDWGLRSLRTVLSGCGRNIRLYRKVNNSLDDINLQTELQLVVKALRMDTLSKLTYADSLKFDALIRDVFPMVSFENIDHEMLVSALETACSELKLEINQQQINKCVELYEQLKQRMGVAIVGPPNSGKSVLRTLLFNALTKMGRILKQHVFNPKSMSRNQLLGQIDIDTRQWMDGVMTMYSLQVTTEPLDVWSWIVCDGDVDPEWVESLNSVLDDNKLLTLPSGWRIQFGPNVNFIFETHDLSYASPATVSRLGIVFLSAENVSLENYAVNFVGKQPDGVQGVLGRYVQDYLYKAVEWVVNEGDLPVSFSKISCVRTGLSQIMDASTKASFTVGLVRGLGGFLDFNTKENFCTYIFELTQELQPHNLPFYYYNQDRDAIGVYTNTISSSSIEVIDNKLPLVMTAQVCHTLDSLRVWLNADNEQHFLIVGPHGSAKSLILKQLVKERSDVEMVTIHCNNHMSPQHVIHKLTECCIAVSSNKGRIYKPKKGNLVLHFKNMHLLKCDRWGTNMLVSFLQQLITYKGHFDHNLDWVGVENVTVVGSLINTNNLSVRFISSVHLYKISSPQPEDLSIIFTSYLSSVVKKSFSNSPTWSSNKTAKLATTIISIYNEVSGTFSSVQEQHYNFSPHDLTKWCQCIQRYNSSEQRDIEQFLLEIMLYEGSALFKDRLTNREDVKKFDDIVNSTMKIHWGSNNLMATLENGFYVPEPHFGASKEVLLTKLNLSEWTDVVKRGINQYEREGENLNMLIIPELLALTAKIAKQLTEPRGNLLLVGRAGVGRRSSVKIVSALESAKLVMPVTFNRPQFNNDLKLAMQFAGLDGEEVYLVFEDCMLNSQPVVDTINAILCSGEVPGLYSTAELETLVVGLKDEASRESYEGNLQNYFIKRVRQKLHVVVCLETNNNKLAGIFESCPVLYQKCCTVWMTKWGADTMKIVPKMFIEKINKEEVSRSLEIESTDGFSEIHSLINTKIASPNRFMSMIKTYIDIYAGKKRAISDRQSKLQAGVEKITEAKDVVAELKIKASKQQEQLAEKQSKANAALDMITNTMQNANTQKQEMEVLKKHTERESFQISKRKQEIEKELSEVKPLIESAQAAVGNIKSESLSEIRSLRAPPDIIRDILEGVLRLMGTQDTSWNSMKNFLSKRGVKEEIRSFDATRISMENRQAVERLMSNRSDSFDPKNAKRASVAAAPLAAWVIANVRYAKVLDNIKPLEREQNKLQQNLTNAELQLEELSGGLLDVDTAVAKLKLQLTTYTKEAAEIEIHLNEAHETLKTAGGLVEKLNDEYERWHLQLKELSEELKILPNYSLLAAAFITFLSEESEDNRTKLLNEWIGKLPAKDQLQDFKLESFLSTEREQLQWQSEGLSTDQLSLQNAIITLRTNICPFLLDPTSVALNWVKSHFKHKVVETVSQNSPKFNTTLELAIRFGKVLIIEDVESISPIIFPILRKQFVHQAERKLLCLNGKLIDYHNDFQLFLCCRNSYVNLSADIASVINTINFITTRTGLSEQLLTSAIKQESPKLEERRKELLKQREELQEKEYNLQNQLLEDLANSSGNILQNKSLMNSLNETKASAIAISAALVESIEVHRKLEEEYNVYKNVSAFGSSLYFAASEFSNMNVLYSLSVSAFVRLFLKSLTPLETNDTNFGIMQKSLMQALYVFMSRGIFKTNRLQFALHLCHKLLPYYIRNEEWNYFIGQLSYMSSSKGDASNLETIPSWIPDAAHQNIRTFQASLGNLYDSLKLNDGTAWKNFMEKNNCESNFPTHCQLSEFQKVIVVQTLRPDRLLSATLQCVLHLTGLRSLNPEVLQLSSIFKETLSSEPILLLTAPGTDPSMEIKKVAQTKVGEDNFIEIAMGEGQESKALRALAEASRLGQWLVLKNLHLVTSWLPELIQNYQTLKPHKSFRLWLVTATHPNFSPVLAQNSLKIVYEIPNGIKSNLLHTYSSWGVSYVEKLNPTGSRILFVLACIHALLQERRTYIPQGWSKSYEFSDIDLSSMVKLAVELYQNQNMQVQWKYLIGLCLDAIYGGRIDNLQDLVILESYLKSYFTDEVIGHRWRPFGSTVSLPTYSNFEEYLNFIKQLSDRDLPSYFGLPENIDRAWEKNIAYDIISNLRDLGVIKAKTERFIPEEFHKKLNPYMALWKKLNQGLDYVRMTLPQPVSRDSSLLTFLQEEYCSGIQLIQTIHKCFAMFKKIMKGNIRLEEEEDFQLTNNLICHRTPKKWQTMWKGPNEPTKYLKDVINKMAHITKFKSEETLEKILRSHINLSFLLHPDTFLIAFKQDISRKIGVPIDQLTLHTSWKPVEDNSFIVISGMLLEGAIFDGYSLSACLSSSESISSAPDCYIHWVLKENMIESGKIIEVPLYYLPNREELLVYLQIPSNFREKEKWIKTGLAFFISS